MSLNTHIRKGQQTLLPKKQSQGKNKQANKKTNKKPRKEANNT